MNSEHLEFPPRSFVRTLNTENKSIINQHAEILTKIHVWISWKGGYLFVSNGVKAGSFNLLGVAMQAHVPQHHDSTEQQGGGVGHVFPCYIWGSSMNLTGKINHNPSLWLTFLKNLIFNNRYNFHVPSLTHLIWISTAQLIVWHGRNCSKTCEEKKKVWQITRTYRLKYGNTIGSNVSTRSDSETSN